MLRITNQREFNKRLKGMIKLVPEMQVDILKKVSFDGFRHLQAKTPEDTARAKGGWNTTVDGKPSEWKPPLGKKHYTRQQFKGAKKIKAGSIIHLTNNVEYIKYLDEGSSQQAPMGIVEPVFARMRIHLETVIKAMNRRKIK